VQRLRVDVLCGAHRQETQAEIVDRNPGAARDIEETVGSVRPVSDDRPDHLRRVGRWHGDKAMRLSGKIAVVTGAARGIGREVAAAFAAEGADVVGIDAAGRVSAIQQYVIPTADDLAVTGRAVEAHGRRWLGIQADIRDFAALQAASARIESEFGPVAILAAIAGIQAFKPILEMEDADWDDQIEVNLTGTVKTLRAFVPPMIARNAGRIILTTSTQGRHGMKNGSAYSASKWGLFGLMKSAALEFAPHGLTVNAVVPGLIDTPLTRNNARYTQVLQEQKGEVPPGDLEKQAAEAMTTKTPLNLPWLPAKDMAPAYVYLASDDARLVSGSAIEVTGGDSAHGI
jgi:NAD(P)-dependent dehydrogenase (short-subunit alcohol dehydrogenase family)